MPHEGLQNHPPLTGGGGESIPLPKSEAQLSCEAKGGKWDPEKKVCILPTPEIPAVTPPQEAPGSGFFLPGELTGNIIDGKPERGTIEVSAADFKRFKDRGLGRVREAEELALTSDIEEKQRILQETGQPVRRELDPTLEQGEATPLIGPLRVKARKAVSGFLKDTAFRNFVDKFNPREQEEFFQLEPEILRTAALTEIEKNEIEKGLTASENFGSFIESLGLGGLSNFAAEKPSENVQTLLKRIKTAKTEATNAEIKVKDGTWRKTYGQEVIDTQKNRIQEVESRIKLLLQDSPEFKFDSDGVNFIEDKILEARGRLFSAEINIISGEAQDPSEIQILIALQESIQKEDFEL